MQVDASHVPLARMVIVFCALLILGLCLTLPLFKFKWRKFMKSSLFVKILFWIPIFLVFVASLYMANSGRLAVLIALISAVLIEQYIVASNHNKHRRLIAAYFVIYYFALLHFMLIEVYYADYFINLMVTLAFASVLADVVAFFLGNYFGRHKLPDALNNKKSWEGVFGQFLGAFLGVVLVNAFIVPVVSVWLFLAIGLGTAAGDLTNSYIKRKVGIKDWSKAIPGHGGFTDRLCSLAGSAVFMYYFLNVTGVL